MRPILLVGSTDAVARKVQGALAEGVRERLRLWTQPVTDTGGIDAVLWSRPAVVVLGPGLVDKVLLRLARLADAVAELHFATGPAPRPLDVGAVR